MSARTIGTDVAVRTRIGAPAKHLDPRAVLRIAHRHVLDEEVRDDVRLPRILHRAASVPIPLYLVVVAAHLPEAPDGDAVRAVAPEVRDDDLRRVGFQRWRTDS